MYETVDDGSVFAELGSVMHCDLVSVDFADINRQTLLAGGHEQARTLYRSADGGMTWSNVGGGLPASTNCTYPLIIDSQTYIVGCAGFGGGVTGIYRTIDSGTTWTKASASGGAGAPLSAFDGSIYWASPNSLGLTRSTDGGKGWSDPVGKGAIGSAHPIELPDGRLAALGRQYVVTSADHGSTWTQATADLPYGDALGLAYSSQQKAFFVWHGDCGNAVLRDAIMRFDFDYKQN